MAARPRQQRTAGIIFRVLSEGLAGGRAITDRVLRNGRAVSIVDVHLNSRLTHARVFWEPHNEADKARIGAMSSESFRMLR